MHSTSPHPVLILCPEILSLLPPMGSQTGKYPTTFPFLPGEPHSSPQHDRGIQLPLWGHICGDKAAESHRGEVPFAIHLNRYVPSRPSEEALWEGQTAENTSSVGNGDWVSPRGAGTWAIPFSSSFPEPLLSVRVMPGETRVIASPDPDDPEWAGLDFRLCGILSARCLDFL